MKKVLLILSLIILLVVGAVIINKLEKDDSETDPTYLRVHIRANSNDDIDQGVKYAVKERVVDLLTPKLKEAETLTSALNIIKNNLSQVELVANEVLNINGFSYSAKASVNVEQFPTRSYQNLVLEAGLYDALIIELGDAVGDNWWCVVYPPLCFFGNENTESTIKYKSFIYELFSS